MKFAMSFREAMGQAAADRAFAADYLRGWMMEIASARTERRYRNWGGVAVALRRAAEYRRCLSVCLSEARALEAFSLLLAEEAGNA